MPPRDEETIENPPTEAAADSGARGPSARQLVGSGLVLALVLGAGIAVGAATRPSSSRSTGRATSATAGTTPSGSQSGLGDGSGGLNVARIAAQVSPSIVDINTTLAGGAGAAAGTGMVMSTSGEVLTNNHVIDDATTVTVRAVTSGRTYTADVVGYDITDDVAVLRLRGASGLTPITTAASPPVLIGQPVVGIGNALGKGGVPTATAGVVSATNQTVTASDQGANAETLHGMIQTDAQIQPGDSGGPLVNADAQVVGMDTAASTPGGRLQQASQTVGFAIPIARVLTIGHQIETGQTGPNIHLGVEVRDSGSSQAGAPVVSVEPSSPAASLGLTAGDSIVSLNGAPIGTSAALTTALAPFHSGQSVTIGWIDTAGHRHTGTVTLMPGPPG